MTQLTESEIEQRIALIKAQLGYIGFESLVQFAAQQGLDGAKSAVDASIRRFVQSSASLPDDPTKLITQIQEHITHHSNQVLDYGSPGAF